MTFVTATVRMVDGAPFFEGETHAAFGLSVPDGQGGESGVSAHWEWDGETFVLRNDLHGYLPLYYHLDARTGALIVSDSPIAILANGLSADLDLESLGFFCRAGFLIGDRTLFDGILRVPSGATLRWSDGRLTIDRPTSRFKDHAPRNIEDAIDGWIERFREAMRRRQPFDTEFAVPLSGGRDSRMMLMELRSLGHEPREVVSFGPASGGDNEDLRIARLIVERLSIPHEVVRTTRRWLDLEQERHAWCGCEAIEHVWMIGLWSYLCSNHHCWYDGLGVGAMTRGELIGPEMLQLLRRGDIEGWCTALYARTASPNEEWVQRITRHAGIDIPDIGETAEYVRTQIEPLLDAPNPLGRFSLDNWGRRAIALNPYGICRSTAMVHTPFMDRDLVDWTASIPIEWTFEDDIQTNAAHRMHPELSDVPYDSHENIPGSGRNVFRRLMNQMDRFIFFRGPGTRFRGLASKAFRANGRDPHARRAMALMVHLVLTDGARDDGMARKIMTMAGPDRRTNRDG